MDARISLCLIVGNESGYIERCLESFLPVADEVVVVRAVGGLAPDDTLERAAAVCRRHGVGLVTGEYRNRAEHADWPHVDDFAAARQLARTLVNCSTSSFVGMCLPLRTKRRCVVGFMACTPKGCRGS